ncbi:MAG: hypothetical protein OEY65_06980 [Gammaproteobacteria bacterium]|nr:hypothetical protein [Gammaproteobacteria bacterium]
MNQSVKAALISALIFPGVGQISVGYKKRGWIIIGINVVLFYLIIREIMQPAYLVIAEMQKSGAAMDIESISNATSKLSGFSDNVFLNILLLIFIAGWIITIFDAYRLGAKYLVRNK